MGVHLSKKTPQMSSDINLNADMETELRSYEAACKLDSDLKLFMAPNSVVGTEVPPCWC